MRVTLVQPSMGRRRGEPFLRSWQMQPLAPALLAGLTPAGVAVRFVDDRQEEIPLEAPTDLVAITVETYTARRAYQIATLYRRRGVPVVMGGVHATLAPDEVALHAEAVVTGEAEAVWATVLDDAARGALARRYHGEPRPDLAGLRFDRSLFAGRRYLPLELVETGRGCRHRCEFCVIAACHGGRRRSRPVGEVVDEVRRLGRRVAFFVDDHITSDPAWARELFRALAPVGARWVSQAGVEAAADPELVALMRSSGCLGLLIGFESLDPRPLARMGKGFNGDRQAYRTAVANLRRHGIEVYATFLHGYDDDAEDAVAAALELALDEGFYLAAFNHLVPFPGTPLYRRLEREGRLLSPAWWLDPSFGFGMVPFEPQRGSAAELSRRCLAARRRYYRADAILGRLLAPRGSLALWSSLLPLSLMMRREVVARDRYPLGDETFAGSLEPVARR